MPAARGMPAPPAAASQLTRWTRQVEDLTTPPLDFAPHLAKLGDLWQRGRGGVEAQSLCDCTQLSQPHALNPFGVAGEGEG